MYLTECVSHKRVFSQYVSQERVYTPIDVLLSWAFLADVYPIDMHLIDVHPTGRTGSSDVNMVEPLLPESLVAGISELGRGQY